MEEEEETEEKEEAEKVVELRVGGVESRGEEEVGGERMKEGGRQQEEAVT